MFIVLLQSLRLFQKNYSNISAKIFLWYEVLKEAFGMEISTLIKISNDVLLLRECCIAIMKNVSIVKQAIYESIST